MELEEAFEVLADWLEDEGHDVDYPSQTGAQVVWGFLADVNGITLQVRALEGQPFVLLDSRVRVDEGHEEVLAEMPPQGQRRFTDALRKLSFQGPEDWELHLQPEDEDPSYVRIYRVLYPGDLTRQGFMDAVRMTRARTQHVIWLVQRVLDTGDDGDAPEPAAGSDVAGSGVDPGDSPWSRTDFEVH